MPSLDITDQCIVAPPMLGDGLTKGSANEPKALGVVLHTEKREGQGASCTHDRSRASGKVNEGRDSLHMEWTLHHADGWCSFFFSFLIVRRKVGIMIWTDKIVQKYRKCMLVVATVQSVIRYVAYLGLSFPGPSYF